MQFSESVSTFNIMNPTVRLILVLFGLSFLVFGCTGKPDTNQLKTDLQQRLEKSSTTGMYRIISVEKTNGKSTDNNYTIEFKGTVECIKDFYVNVGGWYGFEPPAPGSVSERLHAKSFMKGMKLQFTGDMVYESTEKGWRPKQESGSVTMSDQYAPHF